MSVQPGPTEKRYAANGVTHTYAVPFLVIEAGDLQVLLNGVTVTSGYVHTGIGQPISSITFTTAPAGDLFLQLSVPFQRLVDYQENGDFLSGTVNRDFDRIWQALKQLLRFSTRSLRLGDNDVDGAGMYRAKGNGIADLKDPVNPQDAVTKSWISSLIDTVSGVINNTIGIAYDGMTLFDYLKSFLYRGVESIDAMCQLSTSRNQRVRVYSYYGDGKSDSRFFRWDAAKAKVEHNGGTVISPTVPRGVLPGNLPAFIAKVGETDPAGFGCWVDENSNHEVHVDQFGAIPGSAVYAVSNYAAIRSAVTAALTHAPVRLEGMRKTKYGHGEYFITGNSVLMLNRSQMIALPGAYRYRRGIMHEGMGRNSTVLTLVSAGTGRTWFYDTSDPNYPGDTSVADSITFSNMTFRGNEGRQHALPQSQQVSGFNFETYGWEKFITWDNVRIEWLDQVLSLSGYGNADHNRFFSTNIAHIREDAIYINNNQAVALTLSGTDIEEVHGSCISIGPNGGGDINWTSGSVVLYPQVDSNNNPLPVQRDRAVVFWDNSNISSGPSSGPGNNKITLQSIRVESYEPKQGIVFSYRTTPDTYGSLRVVLADSSFAQPLNFSGGIVAPTIPYTGMYLENEISVKAVRCVFRAPYTFQVGDNNAEILFDDCEYLPPLTGASTQGLAAACSVLSQGGSILARNTRVPLLIAEGDYSRTRLGDFTMGISGRMRAYTAMQAKHQLTPWPQPGFSVALRTYIPVGSIVRSVTIDKPQDTATGGSADYVLSVRNSSGTTLATTGAGATSRAIVMAMSIPNGFKVPAEPNNYIEVFASGTGGGSIFEMKSGNILVEYV